MSLPKSISLPKSVSLPKADTTPAKPEITSFKDLPLSPALARSIEELGFTVPSPVQARALPILLGDPTDFIGLAATGTGKTAAFAIPLLERIDVFTKSVQAIVLCPTRELAIQVAGQIELLGKHQGVKAAAIYGGAGYGDQIAALRRGAQIVVGTPGRVIDHLEKGTLDLGLVQVVVLDEADEMISMGFKDDLEAILASVPGLALGDNAEEVRTSNIWLFSATMSREIRGISENYLDQPAHVEINRTEMLPENLEQIYYATSESNKPEVLCKIIDAAEDFYGIIFCQTKALVIDLVQYLVSRGYAVDALHGDMDQKARERTMRSYRERNVKMLVCTDVASRGIDVKDITHVVNYSIPRELDSYVHRIGRTARNGKKGYAMSLVTPSHRALLGRIERMTKSRVHEGKIPTRKEIGLKKVAAVLGKLDEVTGHERALELVPADVKAKIAAMNSSELASRFLSLMMPEVFAERTEEPSKSKSTRPVSSNTVSTSSEGGQVVIRVNGLSSDSESSERAEQGYHARKQGGFIRGADRGDRRFGGRDSRSEGRSDGGYGDRRPSFGRKDFAPRTDSDRPAPRRWGQPAGESRGPVGFADRKPGGSFGSDKFPRKPYGKPFAKAAGKVFSKPYPTRSKGPVGLKSE